MRIDTATVALWVERHGPHDGPPLILIRGLGTQLIFWPSSLIEGFVRAGFHVIVFDNRDCGLSQRCPPLRAGVAAYGIQDMADDVAALMVALGIDRADILGISLGGMILQTLALSHPDRVSHAVICMSSSGNPDLPRASPEVTEALTSAPPSQTRADVVAHGVRTGRLWQSPAWPFDLETQADLLGRAYDRGHCPEGTARQFAALMDWRATPPAIEGIAVPTLVIHGTEDALLPLPHGLDIADRIPGAERCVIPGMGHDLEGDIPGLILRRAIPFLTRTALR